MLLLTPALRGLLATLRLTAAAGLLALAAQMAWRYGWQVNALAQIQLFLWAVLAPLLLGWAIARGQGARASLQGELLVIEGQGHQVEIPIANIARVRSWRWPLPGPGVTLELAMASPFGSVRTLSQWLRLR